ncbi:hypothetical protein K492DRAFT_151908 [Lichtheimia hyalospora FSU 10163]|nr:hypothetical protein K492DRAFT_151908 [Lichtheimia hyalospora FSU 10163]
MPAKAPLSKAQEEEMSSALIAKLLAEDAMGGGNTDDYYAEYSNDHASYDQYHGRDEDDGGSYEEMSDDDMYAPRRKQSRGKKASNATAGKRGRKRKTTDTTQENAQSSNDPTNDTNTTTDAAANDAGKKSTVKKPRKPVPEGCNSGVYSEKEEALFLEGLEKFGRDWHKLTEHIGTREPNSIRSHAQKYFIKLYRDNIPLPEKVRESGEGYTLSGKPLDPESAAARAYLGRSSSGTRPSQKQTQQQQPLDQQNTQQPAQPEQSDKADSTANNPDLKIGEADKKEKAPTPPREKKKVEKKSTPEPRPASPSPYDENGRTDYSKRKLRRTRERTAIAYSQLNKDDDPLTMVKCEPFTGKPGSDITGCQPFELQVHSNVLLAMDFHAHLMTTEIIGFLAGEWDKEHRRMCIKEAFPCRSLNTGQNDVNVEMDPTSAIETRQRIEEKNMTVVGWYHSHPMFAPDPSIVDLENQQNYQTLCREKCGENGNQTVEPFVGAIIGPYDPRLPGSLSVVNWFYVSDSKADRGVPKRLIYELQEDESLCDEQTERLLNLLEVYKDSPEKVDFTDMWRQDIHENKLEKLIKSLGMRMPWIHKEQSQDSEQQVDSFLNNVRSKLKDW